MIVQVIGGLRELAPHYDGFILDLWGVILTALRRCLAPWIVFAP